MNAQTRQKIIIASLPVAMLWGIYNLFWNEQKPPLTQQEVTLQVVTKAEKSEFIIDSLELQRIEKTKWGSDPFKSVIKRTPKPTDKHDDGLKLILSGIVFNEKSPMAVINKKTVRPGDVVGSARVVSISRVSVLMEQNGKRFLLKVTKG